MFVINYSFQFRYKHDRVFSVNVPLERLAGADLSVKVVRDLIEDDYELFDEMMGDYQAEYLRQNEMSDYWAKNLERESEGIRIMAVNP